MPQMPTLGETPRKSPVPGIAITAVIVGTLAGAVYWWTHKPAAPAPAAELAQAAPPAAPGAGPAAPGAQPAAPVAAAAPTAAAPAAPELPAGLKVLTTTVKGPLEGCIVAAVGKDTGVPLTQVVTRSLVWWLRVPQDLTKGDTLSALYEERPNQEPLVHAVRYTSRKLNKTWEAWRYKAPGDAFARLYLTDGTELEERLADAPLDSWEQITSLLRDGRHHKGVDFKTPLGTPVKATFDGVVARKTWNFHSNGNSLDIQEAGGKHRNALYLHLSEIPKAVEVGQRVKKGEVIARSGNTGHSFAPHLHYQLMQGEQVLDPFEGDGAHRALPEKDKPGFDREVARLRPLLPAEVVAGG